MDTKDFEEYYNNYVKLSKLGIISLGASCCASFLGFSSVFLPLWLSGNGICIIASISKNKFANCTEYAVLRESYAYVLEHIVNLSKKIDYTDVEEVYALFEYLISNNYLSFNHNITNETINSLPCEKTIQAELTLNNHGVCRNRAYALANIYQELNMKAGIIPGVHIETTIEIDPEKNPKLMELLEQDPNVEVLIKIFDEIYKEAYPELNTMDKNIKKAMKRYKQGNHAITVVNHNDKSYYFDPSLHNIYYEDQSDKNKLTSPTGTLFMTSPKMKKPFMKDLNGYIDREYDCAEYYEVAHNFEIALERLVDYNETLNDFHKSINPSLENAENAFQSLRKSIR